MYTHGIPPPPFGATPTLQSHSAPKPRTSWSPVERIVYSKYRSPERVAMCNSFLGSVLLDTTKSQNKGTTLLYRRFPPPTAGFSEFRASSPETREREVDVGEAPTQRVMVCREYTTLMKLVNTWYTNPYLLVPPRRSIATLRRNPGLDGAERTYHLRHIPEPGEGSNVQLFSWFLFDWTLPIHKQGYNPPLQKIPPRQLVSRSLWLAVQKLERERSRCR